MLTIQNNFVSQQQLDKIWNAFESNPVWVWRTINAGAKSFWIYDIFDKLDFVNNNFVCKWKNNPDPVFLEILEQVKKLAGNTFVPWRFIVNKQVLGLDSGIHADFKKEEQQSTTFLLYLNKTWQPEWGGETVFYNDEKNEIKRCSPEPGKLISYNAQQYHQGLAPKVNNISRITLAIQGKYNS